MGKKNKSPSPFVMVRVDLLKDPEWRKLSSTAKVVYIYLRAKFNNETLNEVTLSYSELTDMISTATISKAIKELVDTGWIEKITQGGLFTGSSVYKFKGKYKDYYYLKQRFKI